MVKEINENEFDSIINEKGKILIDCYATWCGPCKMLSPVIDEVAKELTNVKFYKIDIDEAENVVTEYNIMSVPTLLLFENSELKETLVGFKSKEELISILNNE